MSLVNEALKRAKEVHDEQPPAAPNLDFHPTDPVRYPRDPWVHLIPAVLAIVGVVVVILAWRLLIQKPPREGFEIEARAAAQSQPLPILPTEAPDSPPAAPSPAVPVVAVPPVVVPAEALPPVKLSPPPLRLQAIFYHPANPSAIISGKTVHRGEMIGELKVMAIDSHTVSLAGAGQTNNLSLPD